MNVKIQWTLGRHPQGGTRSIHDGVGRGGGLTFVCLFFFLEKLTFSVFWGVKTSVTYFKSEWSNKSILKYFLVVKCQAYVLFLIRNMILRRTYPSCIPWVPLPWEDNITLVSWCMLTMFSFFQSVRSMIHAACQLIIMCIFNYFVTDNNFFLITLEGNFWGTLFMVQAFKRLSYLQSVITSPEQSAILEQCLKRSVDLVKFSQKDITEGHIN